MHDQADPEGYTIDVYQSLVHPIHYGGVPRGAAIAIWTVAAILAFPLQLPWVALPFGAVAHGTAAFFTKRDPWFFEVLKRHLHQPTHWE
ncbi:MAG: VirB3 family type IV secretion system protein [Zavarzinia sp.]|nr:VirB3 family type IV secretion system protein [Zavarzinia sp.]